MKKWSTYAAAGVLLVAVGVAACTGIQGPAGQAGPAGPPGPAAMAAGAQGAPSEAGAVAPRMSVSDTAQQGLAISPVPLDLTGLSFEQIETLGNGSYIANALTDCANCHGGAPAYLGGGCAPGAGGVPACTGFAFAAPSFSVFARNLTPDPATGLKLTEEQFITAMRTGADYHTSSNGGAPSATMVVMPWFVFRWMSLYDLRSIYAYLRAVPRVHNEVPPDTKTAAVAPAPIPPVEPTAYTMGDQKGSGTPLPPQSTPTGPDASAPVPDPSFVLRGLAINPLVEVHTSTLDPTTLALFGRGSYIVNAIAACSDCHTNAPAADAIAPAAYLSGGQIYDMNLIGVPAFVQKQLGYARTVSTNLTGATHGFFNAANVDFGTFETLMTQGIHAEDPRPERSLAFPMPWTYFRKMTLPDLQAVYTYMNQVARQYGLRRLTGSKDKVVPEPAAYCDPSTPCASGWACSSSSGPGECLHQTCARASVVADCAICQTCSAATGGVCRAITGNALAACAGKGL